MRCVFYIWIILTLTEKSVIAFFILRLPSSCTSPSWACCCSTWSTWLSWSPCWRGVCLDTRSSSRVTMTLGYVFRITLQLSSRRWKTVSYYGTTGAGCPHSGFSEFFLIMRICVNNIPSHKMPQGIRPSKSSKWWIWNVLQMPQISKLHRKYNHNTSISSQRVK